MAARSVLIRCMEEDHCWRLFWRDNMEQADDRSFASMEAAVPTAWALMGYDGKDRRPDLKLVK